MLSNLHRFHSPYRFPALCSLLLMTTLFATIAFVSTAHADTNSTYYRVQHGDTLSNIAQYYGLSTGELMYANALSNADHIHSGDRLYIPAQTVHYGQSCRYYHRVSPGQTLSWIAVHYGIDSHVLAQANHVHDYDHIEMGTNLCIPIRGISSVVKPAARLQKPARQPRSIYQQPSASVPATATPYPLPSPTTNPLNYYPEPNGYAYYTVRSSDTLQSVAAYYQTTAHHLSVLNPGVVFTSDTIWLVPLYVDIPIPPTSTPRFYPTITPMPPTSTAIFYPTLTPRPPTATPLPTATRRPTAVPVQPAPVQPIQIEINIAPNITQQGFSIDSVDGPSGSTVIVSTATPTSGAASTGTTPLRSVPISQQITLPPTLLPPTIMPEATSAATPVSLTPTPDFAGVESPWMGQYFVNPNLGGQPFYTNHNANINFNWGSDGPGNGLPSDEFGVRWMAYEQLEAGRYTFRVYVEGGVRLYVDGKLLINKWHDGSGNFVKEIDLEDGYHTIQVDYGKLGSNAQIRVWWTKQ